MNEENIIKILERNEANRDGLISALGEIQDEYGYLPEEALRIVSDKTDRSLIDIFEVAAFYKSFNLKPRGKNLIHVCLGTACHVRGAPLILEEIERKLDIKPDETTADHQYTLKTVNCLGACALGPIVVMNKNYHGNMTIQKVSEILPENEDELNAKGDN